MRILHIQTWKSIKINIRADTQRKMLTTLAGDLLIREEAIAKFHSKKARCPRSL